MPTHTLNGYGWPLKPYHLVGGQYEFEVVDSAAKIGGSESITDWLFSVRITEGPLAGYLTEVRGEITADLKEEPNIWAELQPGVRFSAVLGELRNGFGVFPASIRVLS